MIEYTIYCDNCGTLIDASNESEKHARERAVQQGVLVRAGSKDLCMSCVDRAIETAVTPQEE